MGEPSWEVVDVISGDLPAELLRGLLVAQDIPAILSQEGVGHSVYPVNVGPLARVEILVPSSLVPQAREVLERFYAGNFEDHEEEENE